MPRTSRYTPGGMVFHVLNRGVGRRALFEMDADYRAFERVIEETILADWPLPRPANWAELVNQPQSEAELAALRKCVNRGRPFGDTSWTEATARSLGIESTLRTRGRPRQRI